jgi:hypothetical protein
VNVVFHLPGTCGIPLSLSLKPSGVPLTFYKNNARGTAKKCIGKIITNKTEELSEKNVKKPLDF